MTPGRSSQPGDVVLDSGAVLAVLTEGPGASWVEAALTAPGVAFIDMVSLFEVMGGLADRGLSPAEIDEAVDALALQVRNVDEDLARGAADLRSEMEVDEESFGRVFAVALGRLKGLPVVSGDARLSGVEGVRIIPDSVRGS